MTIPELDPDFWTPDEHKVTPKWFVSGYITKKRCDDGTQCVR
jgi:hypothetical protein